MTFRFRLIDARGVDLGPLVSSQPNWRPGDRIQRGHGDELVVTAVVEPEDAMDARAYLVVEPASGPPPD